MQDKFVANQARYRFFPIQRNVPVTLVIGVSGGADSVLLLHILHSLIPIWTLKLHVAHLNHNLRDDSAEDAAFVAELADKLDLPFHYHELAPGQLSGLTGGLENAARNARYSFLLKVAVKVTPSEQVPILTVAHHADDQAETVLMNLVRGAGPTGLRGMQWVSERTGIDEEGRECTVLLVRPLLNIHRSEIRAHLRHHGLTWREDQSNADPSFTRNRLRLQIIPALEEINPNVVSSLCRTAELLSAEVARTSKIDSEHLTTLRLPLYEGSVEQRGACPRIALALDGFHSLDPAARRGVLRQALAMLGGEPDTVGFPRIEELIHSLESGSCAGGPFPLAQQICWTQTASSSLFPAMIILHRRNCVALQSPYPRVLARWVVPDEQPFQIFALDDAWQLRIERQPVGMLPHNWKSQALPWRAYFDADGFGQLALDRPRPGLRFAPLGLNGHHKLLGDFMTDSKIPRAVRATWPLLIDADDGRIIWVCGLRQAHHARIRQETTNMLCLRWQHRESEPESSHER